MMPGGGSHFDAELAAVAAWAARSYSSSSGHGGAAQQHFVRNDGGAPSAGAAPVPDAASGVYGGNGGGMGRPASFAGYGSGGGAPMAMAAPARPPPSRARAHSALFKAVWTNEEDKTLTEAVRQHGHEHRKWAAISLHLPGRNGKQCRERWVNHVDPTIRKKMWTEAEDRELIAAHQSCGGNRWSSIARKLTGRSEISVKNHWNATMRSLRAKRKLRKRNCEQPPHGKLSLLAQYIRSLDPATESRSPASPLAPTLPTVPDDQDQQVGPDTSIAATPLAYAAPAMASMYYHQNPENVQHSWEPDMNAAAGYPYYIPPYPQLDHRLPYDVAPTTPMMSEEDLEAAVEAYASMDDMYPFTDRQSNLRADQAEVGNAGGGGGSGANGWCSYGADGAGPSRSVSGGGDDVNVVQMASREFEASDQCMVTLDHLTRFN